MKRKRYAATIFILLAVALVALAGWFPFNIQKQVVIHASLYDISKQFTDLHNWPSWYPALKETRASAIQFTAGKTTVNSAISWDNKNTISVTATNPAAIVTKETNQGKVNYHTIEGFPIDNGNSTIISWSEKLNGWKWIQEKLSSSGNITTALNELKKKCEDPEKEYGFDIKIQRVWDTVIATKKINTSIKEKLSAQQLLYHNIQSFLQAQHIPIVKSYMYTSVISIGQQDSIVVAVGIPVYQKGRDSNEIKFLELPATGRLLVGSYTGLYKDVNRLYEAMDGYVKDKGLKIVAQQMEQHSNFSLLSRDSALVTLKVIYPVY